MQPQDVVGIIALAGILLVALGFIYVVLQAGKPADEAAARKSAHTSHVVQAILFVVLLVGFVAGTWATLAPYPIAEKTKAADQVVKVVGHQWYWIITPATVETGTTVAFNVTSADVNHGFAIYAPDGHIVTMTQAMPGYTNTVLYTFHEPGTYKVQCLEYCGIAHAPMKAFIQVVAAKGE